VGRPFGSIHREDVTRGARRDMQPVMAGQIAVQRHARRRDIASTVSRARVAWTARRVEVDRGRRCPCGAPLRVVSCRVIAAGESLAHWVVVSEVCDAGCAESTAASSGWPRGGETASRDHQGDRRRPGL
jgi:hypothetical protein